MTFDRARQHNVLVRPVGLKKDGSFAIGESVKVDFIYKGGASPCATEGEAIIAEHSNHLGYGVGNNLWRARVGDLAHYSQPGTSCDLQVTDNRYVTAAQLRELIQSATNASTVGPPKTIKFTCDLKHYDWKHHRYRGWRVVELEPVA